MGEESRLDPKFKYILKEIEESATEFGLMKKKGNVYYYENVLPKMKEMQEKCAKMELTSMVSEYVGTQN